MYMCLCLCIYIERYADTCARLQWLSIEDHIVSFNSEISLYITNSILYTPLHITYICVLIYTYLYIYPYTGVADGVSPAGSIGIQHRERPPNTRYTPIHLH